MAQAIHPHHRDKFRFIQALLKLQYFYGTIDLENTRALAANQTPPMHLASGVFTVAGSVYSLCGLNIR